MKQIKTKSKGVAQRKLSIFLPTSKPPPSTPHKWDSINSVDNIKFQKHIRTCHHPSQPTFTQECEKERVILHEHRWAVIFGESEPATSTLDAGVSQSIAHRT